MKREEKILYEVEKTLNAMDNLNNLESNPFLYTKLSARISDKHFDIKVYSKSFLMLKQLVIALLIAFNVFTIIVSLGKLKQEETNTYSLIEVLRTDYNINVSNYENYKAE